MKFNKIVVFITAFIGLFLFITGCSEEDASSAKSLNYVSFDSAVLNVDIPEDESVAREVKVYTTSKSGSDRTFNVVVDTELTTLEAPYYTVPQTVVVPANSNVGSFMVDVTGTNIGNGKSLFVKLVPESGLSVGKSIELKVKNVCLKNSLKLDLILDRYGSETTWELYNSALEVIASGGPYTDAATNGNQAPKVFDFCLDNGAYTFVIYDSYDDGICCSQYGNGSYTLTNTNSSGSTVVATGGQFGAFEVVEFTLD